jgi:hypothetical protein
LKGYRNTLEEDREMIEKDQEGSGPEPMTENKRNAVLMRSGEKAVLHYLSNTVDLLLPLLDKTL